MASDKIKKRFIEHTESVTTSASGSASLHGYPDGVAVSGRCTSQDSIVIPVYTQTGVPWVKVQNWDLSPVSNKTVTVVVTFAR
jgi:hypothetical protein